MNIVREHDQKLKTFETKLNKEILTLYRNDIKEQEAKNSEYVGNILDNIPSELSKHDYISKTNTFHLSHISKNVRLREYKVTLR